MRKKKKIELAEALGSLCRDAGYKNVTSDNYNNQELAKRVVDLLNHTIDFGLISDIHERLFPIVLQDKKIFKLLRNETFVSNFNDASKGISKYKKVSDKDAAGMFHLNNYFGLDLEKFYFHCLNNPNGLENLVCRHHKITGDDDPFYVNTKKAAVYDTNGNLLIRVLFKKKGFVFKQNNLPFALEFDSDSGILYAMSYEYRDSLSSFKDIDVEKCLGMIAIDCINDSPFTYAWVCNAKHDNEHLTLIVYCAIACMCSISNALISKGNVNAVAGLVALNMILGAGRR